MRLASNLLLLSMGMLTTLGLVVLYSASTVNQGARFLQTQLAFCGLGVVAACLTAWFDYRKLRPWAWLFYLTALVLVILVLVPGVGAVRGNARRWFNLGFASFQPSEFAKLAMVITLAAYGTYHRRRMSSFLRGLVIPGLLLLPVCVAVFREPDYGGTILIGTTSLVVLFIAGVRLHHLLPLALIVALGLGVAIWESPIRRARVLAFLHPELDQQGAGYQGQQSVVALGAGGWKGVGLGNGRQKHGFVAEHTTDFIFCMVGEELGLIATMGVLLLFGVMVCCGVYIAWNARDDFGLLLAAGITFFIGLQVFVNIGVATGALPNKGLSLPFISRGGSNLLITMVSMGLLFSVARRADDSAEVELLDEASEPDGVRDAT